MQGRTKYIENNNNYTFNDDCGIVRVMSKTKARMWVVNYMQEGIIDE